MAEYDISRVLVVQAFGDISIPSYMQKIMLLIKLNKVVELCCAEQG